MFNKLPDIFGRQRNTEADFTTIRSTEDSTGSLIRLEGICKTFVMEDVHTDALRDIHLEVERGEFAPPTHDGNPLSQ